MLKHTETLTIYLFSFIPKTYPRAPNQELEIQDLNSCTHILHHHVFSFSSSAHLRRQNLHKKMKETDVPQAVHSEPHPHPVASTIITKWDLGCQSPTLPHFKKLQQNDTKPAALNCNTRVVLSPYVSQILSFRAQTKSHLVNQVFFNVSSPH